MTTIDDPYPLRFRSLDEWHAYCDSKLSMAELVQPGTPEYDAAPYEVRVIARVE